MLCYIFFSHTLLLFKFHLDIPCWFGLAWPLQIVCLVLRATFDQKTMLQIGNFLYFFNNCFSTGSVLYFWNVYYTRMQLTLRQHVFELHESITRVFFFSVLNTTILHNAWLLDSQVENPRYGGPPTKLIFNCLGVGAPVPPLLFKGQLCFIS